MKFLSVLLVGIVLFAASGCESSSSPKNAKLASPKDSLSYTLGVRMGESIKSARDEINLDVVMSGVYDAMSDDGSQLTEDQLKEHSVRFQRTMQEKENARRKEEIAKNIEEGKTFLEENKEKEGVVTLPSGLQYKILKKGSGKSPKKTDTVLAHYRGTLIDGTQFDSSYDRGQPSEFPVNRVIAGWTEALQLMKEGGKWELYIPQDLAYGSNGRGKIPPAATLLFTVELVEVK